MAPQNIVVVGGGVIGCSTAFFLATSAARGPQTSVTLVEETDIACAASGKAGGLCALDWHGKATASMSALSYRLHAELAKQHDGRSWGYREVDTLSVTTDASIEGSKPSPVPWVPSGVIHASRPLGTTKTTAQVHPELFTKKMHSMFMDQPRTATRIASASGLTLDSSKSVKSLQITDKSGSVTDLPADAVVICTGPWTGRVVQELLPATARRGLNVEGSRAHSIVIKTKEPLTAHALFTDMTFADGSAGEPEVYTRPDGATYICGASDNEPMPRTAAEVTFDPKAVSRIREQANALGPAFQYAETLKEQACFLPIPEDGHPLIGKVKKVDGVYIGAGHSCWGITQGPGTGKVLAELILEGKVTSADVSKLTP